MHSDKEHEEALIEEDNDLSDRYVTVMSKELLRRLKTTLFIIIALIAVLIIFRIAYFAFGYLSLIRMGSPL